ncbi:MAG: deoxyribose-phosphate aldolase [Deltaproteobacteria bacterium CG11_big_fil_rev_8_21_14_0_20_45_16]|nr:MAG: deoxyribose-phosphate aldolase [Deltaproteobacteria bacterium CG11_big_fil_rev_8_21_14_0_20_45_16]
MSSELAKKIDHTLLKADTTKEQIQKLCKEAKSYGFFSVCINPYWVPAAKQELTGSSVRVCSVVGFPLGANTSELKAFETQQLLRAGVHEIDMVMNTGALKSGLDLEVLEDIERVIQAAKSCPVKVIIETAVLSEEEKVRASEICVKAGAAFVKTSTGFMGGGATVEDIKLIRLTVGSLMGIKASGGVKTYEQAMQLLEAGATRLGCSQSVAIMKEVSS